MNDIILTIVVLVSVVCVYLTQNRATPKPMRRTYSLLGSIASILIAIEAGHRELASVTMLFMLAALISLTTLVLDYLKTSKPDA